MKKISIIIPTRDEEEGIAKVLCSIPKEVERKSEIIVVDCSKDTTPIIAKRLGAKVVSTKRKGKGYAMRLGAKIAKGDILVFLDGDGTDPPQYIPAALEKLKKYDLVLVSRNVNCKKSDRKNAILFMFYLPIMKNFFRLLGFKTRGDPLAGFRCIRKETWNKLNLKSNDFLIETEMNLKAVENKLKVGEIALPVLKRCGGVLKSKLVRSPNQWMKIFNYGIKYAQNKIVKRKLMILREKFIRYVK